MDRDYYTVPEAAAILDCKPEDIYHLLETNRLAAAVYSKQRKYCITTWDSEEGACIGHGTTYYRGLLLPYQSWIISLIENKEFVLSSTGEPLQTNQLTNYTTENPFLEAYLPSQISKWEPVILENLPNSIELLPFPLQRKTGLSTIAEMIDHHLLKPKEDEPDRKESIKEYRDSMKSIRYSFNYKENGTFTVDDIRLTKEALKSLSAPEEELPWCNSKKKHTAIDPVIERLYKDGKSKTVKQLWGSLRKDHDSEQFRYDPDEVISVIDAVALEWIITSGIEKQMKYKTFTNKISDIRMYYGD